MSIAKYEIWQSQSESYLSYYCNCTYHFTEREIAEDVAIDDEEGFVVRVENVPGECEGASSAERLLLVRERDGDVQPLRLDRQLLLERLCVIGNCQHNLRKRER